jgi:hypothetical protein
VAAAGVFGCGAAVLAAGALLGRVGGFDRADGGGSAPTRLRGRDLAAWPWPWLPFSGSHGQGPSTVAKFQAGVSAIIANPLMLALFLGLLAVALVWVMVRVGGELEHADGGQPQTIVPTRLTRKSLRDLPGLTGWKRLMIFTLLTLGMAVLLAFHPGGGLAVLIHALLPGLVLGSLFLAAVVLLHWWSRPARAFAPWTAYAGDRRTTQVVTVVVGVILIGLTVLMSWWLGTGGQRPSLGQYLWILTGASVAAGATRGVHLGAGLGCAAFLRLRPEFGVGYAARLALTQQVLRRDGAVKGSSVPLDFGRLLDLRHADDEVDGPARPVLGVMRLVGARYEFRHPTLRDHLLTGRGSADLTVSTAAPTRATSPENPPVGKRRVLRRPAANTAGILVAALLLTSTITGVGSFLSTRGPCAHRSGFWPSLQPTVWLENGQCVGVITPVDSTNWFSAPGTQSAKNEQRLADALRRIARSNKAAGYDNVTTVVFFSPLSRAPGKPDQQTINGLWQLEGAAEAQGYINTHAQPGQPKVRLAVANAGTQFAAGVSVAKAITRYPQASAVIGISQSRTITRAALAQLPESMPIVGASVNGTFMRTGGLGGDTIPALRNFESVAPSNIDVAKALVNTILYDQNAREKRSLVVYDPDDLYYGNDLKEDINKELDGKGLDYRERRAQRAPNGR